IRAGNRRGGPAAVLAWSWRDLTCARAPAQESDIAARAGCGHWRLLLPTSPPMLTLYDYLPSQNAWKVRQLLRHLSLEHRTVEVSIFEGEGRTPEFLAHNPTGKVPVLQLDDGRTLAESNAILSYLADGTQYLPSDPYARAKVHQWLSFEQENVEAVIGSLRHWTMTGKRARRAPDIVAAKRAGADRSLRRLDEALSRTPFL